MQGRRTETRITYAGRDVTADLRPYLVGVSYSSSLTGQADDLQLTLDDRDELWSSDWLPEFGDELEVEIEAESWSTGELRRLPVGLCAVDEVVSSGPPKVVTLKAISAALTTGLRRTKRTRAWTSASVQTVAEDIAKRAGLALDWSAPDFKLERCDQRRESDLSFLRTLCEEHGLGVKVSDGALAVFLLADLEGRAPIAKFRVGSAKVTRWSIGRSSTDLYSSCVVRYRDPRKGQTITATYPPLPKGQKKPAEPVLRETRRAEDQAHAELLAEQLLQRANEAATSGTMTVVGDPALVSGAVVDIQGFGFSGRYLITDDRHSTTGGYETSLTLRLVL